MTVKNQENLFSSTQGCPGQCPALLRVVPDSAQLYSRLSQTVPSFNQGCPGQRPALLRIVPDSAQFYSGLSRTAPSYTKGWLGQHPAWLSWRTPSCTHGCPGQCQALLTLEFIQTKGKYDRIQ